MSATINVPKIRVGSSIPMAITLTDNGVAVDWSSVEEIVVMLYFEGKKLFGGKCTHIVSGTTLNVMYSADKPQFLGVADVVVNCKYLGMEKTFDRPVVEFVATTAEATGQSQIARDPLAVDIDVEDVDTSLLDAAIHAAVAAAEAANEAASHGPMIGEDGYWYVWDAAQGEYVNTGVYAEGSGGGSDTSNCVKVIEQFFSMEQKAQARANIAAGTYSKPAGGIPEADLASGVVPDVSGKADKATTLAGYGITDAKIENGTITLGSNTITPLTSHQDITGKADKVSGATNNNFAGLDANGNLKDSGKKASDFATAAQGAKADTAVQPESGKGLFSGSYNDLTNKPTIPAAQVNSDWNASSGVAQILNKPTIPDAVVANPTVPSGTTPTELTGLKVGSDYYKIPEGGEDYITVAEDGFFVIDPNYNIGLKLDEDGFDAIGLGGGKTYDTIPRPERIVVLNFATEDTLPTTKDEDNPILAYGTIEANFDGLIVRKYATIEVQGRSSSVYPKKNWTIAFYNDEQYEDEYKFRLANLVPHSEYVFKANYIDATHCRNIASNRLWEQFVQSRHGFPKRETEFAYDETDTDVLHRMDSGALGHVEGFPSVLYINGAFYGIGDFNIGKKRINYNLNKNNQNHIQLASEEHSTFTSYVPGDWEIRNPKTPDAYFRDKIDAWFDSNALTGSAFKSAFETTHNLKNAIDYLILIEFLYADDCVDHNFLLTSWDGEVFSFMPYDLDTTFNLYWNGSAYTNGVGSVTDSSNNITASAKAFWDEFLEQFRDEIVARYDELRELGILSVDNIYRLCTDLSRRYGSDLFEQEFNKWQNIPSNTTIHTSIPQILSWVATRLAWMDTYFVTQQ